MSNIQDRLFAKIVRLVSLCKGNKKRVIIKAGANQAFQCFLQLVSIRDNCLTCRTVDEYVIPWFFHETVS